MILIRSHRHAALHYREAKVLMSQSKDETSLDIRGTYNQCDILHAD